MSIALSLRPRDWHQRRDNNALHPIAAMKIVILFPLALLLLALCALIGADPFVSTSPGPRVS